MLKQFTTRLSELLKNEEGSASIEGIIWLPLVLTVLLSTFSFHDAFRYKALNTKAAFTISDVLSRETEAIDDAYLDGMVELLEYLTRSEGPYSVRVSHVRYDNDDGYLVEWSHARGSFTGIDTANVGTIQSHLPTMLHNERLIVVETFTDYNTPFDLDVLDTAELFYNVAVTRPRFAPQLLWANAAS